MQYKTCLHDWLSSPPPPVWPYLIPDFPVLAESIFVKNATRKIPFFILAMKDLYERPFNGKGESV